MNWLLFILMALSLPQEVDARPTVLVVVGAEGETEFGGHFTTWAERWGSAAKKGDAEFVQIGRKEPPANAPTDKEHLQATIAAELKKDAEAPLWIVLIGHGTHDGREAKFNLRGPDVSDQELAGWLKPCNRPLAVINCSSSSA